MKLGIQANKRFGFILYATVFLAAVIVGIAVARNQWLLIGAFFFSAFAIAMWTKARLLYYLLPLVAFYWLPILTIGYGSSSYNITVADIFVGLFILMLLSDTSAH